MPNEITAQIFIESSNDQAMGANREILFTAFLNEGFDRPFWQEVNRPKTQVWVPAKSGEELVTGIYMAASHVSREIFPFTFEESVQAVDLNNSNDFPRDEAIKWAVEKLSSYTVCLAVYEDSVLVRDLDSLKSFGVKTRVLSEPGSSGLAPKDFPTLIP